MMKNYTTFIKLGPKKFFGRISGVAATEWVLQMEKLFKALGIPDCGERVRLASMTFEGQAEAWLLSFSSSHEVQHMRWATFLEHFYREHFPRSERNALRSQFEGLKQREMTVADYRGEFTPLERYAPGVCPDEAERARRFYEGLRRELYLSIASNIYQRLSDAVDAATIRERAQALPDEPVQVQQGKRRSD